LSNKILQSLIFSKQLSGGSAHNGVADVSSQTWIS